MDTIKNIFHLRAEAQKKEAARLMDEHIKKYGRLVPFTKDTKYKITFSKEVLEPYKKQKGDNNGKNKKK